MMGKQRVDVVCCCEMEGQGLIAGGLVGEV